MNYPRQNILLILCLTLISLAFTLPAADAVLAAPSGQSTEELFRAILEEANQILGWGFSWETAELDSNLIASYYMSRPPPAIENDGSADLALYLDEVLWIRVVVESPCEQYPHLIPMTFHGMEGCYDAGTETGLITSLFWQPEVRFGPEGYKIILSVFSIGKPQGTQGAEVLAEALHQAAVNNGLYGQDGDQGLPADSGSPPPDQPGGNPEPTASEPIFDVPLVVVLGSLGLPIAGSLTGTIMAVILSRSSGAAGAGVRSSGGNAAIDAPTAENPVKKGENPEDEKQISAAKMDFLRYDLDLMNQALKEDKAYVLNPYQGDPTLLVHRLNTTKNMLWDATVGRLTGSQGLTCEGYVKKTRKDLEKIVFSRFPDATIQEIVFEEKSSIKENQTWGEWFDSLNPDNHILNKIILKDGSEWAVDFHQQNAGNSPLLRPWSETEREWKEYLGEEFFQRPRRITTKDD